MDLPRKNGHGKLAMRGLELHGRAIAQARVQALVIVVADVSLERAHPLLH